MILTCLYPMSGVQLIKATEATATDTNGFTWTYELFQTDGVNYIRLLSTTTTRSQVVIPSKLDGYVVKELGCSTSCSKVGDLFYKCETLEKVTIPNTIVKITPSAFRQCPILKTVVFESEDKNTDRTLNIGYSCFNSCPKLETVTFPTNLKLLNIGDGAFEMCSNLSVSEFPTDTMLAGGAFHTTKMQHVEFKGNVIMSGAAFGYAFESYGGTIKFDKNAILGGGHGVNAALACNSNLQEIIFCGETTLSEGAFANDKNLRQITWGTKTTLNLNFNNSVSGLHLFSGCNSLKTFEFQKFDTDSQIDFQGVINANIALDNVIYNGDIKMNYWINAKNVIFKGHVNITDRISVSEQTTDNIYCYPYDIDFTNLTAENINFYGIVGDSNDANYKLKSYVASQKGCALNSIVESVSMYAESSDYILGDEKLSDVTIDGSKIKGKVTAKFVNESATSTHIIQLGDGVTGYSISSDNLVANSNNTFHVNYSGATGTFKQLVRYKKLTGITAKVNDDSTTKQPLTITAGTNALTKKDISVIATYEDGTTTDVTYQEGCVIENHTIVPGSENKVKITFTSPYSGESANAILQINGAQKNISNYEITVDDDYVAVIGEVLDIRKFHVFEILENGQKEEISNTNIKLQAIELVPGKNNVTVTYNGKNYSIIITAKKVTITAKYIGNKVITNGDNIDLKDIEVSVTTDLGNGNETTTKLLSSDYALSNEKAGYIYVKKYDQTVEVEGIDIPNQTTQAPTTASPITTDNPNMQPTPSLTPEPTNNEGYTDAKEFNQTTPSLKVKSYKTYFKIWLSLPKEDKDVTYLIEYCSEDSGVFYTATTMSGDQKSCTWKNKLALKGCKIQFRVTASKQFDGATVKTKSKKSSGMYLMSPLKNVDCKVKGRDSIFTWKKYPNASGFIIKLTVSNPKKQLVTKKIKVKKGTTKYVLKYNKLCKMYKKLKTNTFEIKRFSVIAYYKDKNGTVYSQYIQK